MIESDFLQMLLNLNQNVILGLSRGMINARFNLESLKCEEEIFDDMTPKEDNWRNFNLRALTFSLPVALQDSVWHSWSLRLEIWW